MNSINPEVNALFQAYLLATGFEMNLTMASERWLTDAIQDGITPDGLALCIAARKKFNRTSSCKKSLLLHKLLRDEDDRAIVLNEIAEARASQRVRVMGENRASVLRQTGRSDAVPTPDAVKVGDLKLVEQLRKAAQ